MKNSIIKAVVYGSVFGAVFGLFQVILVASGISAIGLLTGPLSLAAYIAALIFLIRGAAKEGYSYGKRFLTGLVFSAMIGVVYGIFAGFAGFIFAEQIAQEATEATGEFFELISEFSDESTVDVDTNIDATPVLNLVGEFFGSIIFNAFWGSLFSLIVAAFFKPEEEPEKKTKTTKKSTKSK